MPYTREQLAVIGAYARIKELLAEVDEIRAMFPKLDQQFREAQAGNESSGGKRKRGGRRGWTAAQKKAAARRMRAYWKKKKAKK